jgi:hypothetical protein
MPALRPSAAVLLSAFALAAARPAAQAQQASPTRPTPPPMQTPTDLAGSTTTYLDFPIQRLRSQVSALKGLQYDAGQDQLPAVLTGIAAAINRVMLKLPDLVSREDIYHFQSPRDPLAPGGLASAQPWNREFKYLLLCRHFADGSTRIEELRTDGKGHPVRATGEFTSPHSFGFAYQWLLFSAANQPEFRFRYLGRQDKGGRSTYVVAFAQIPGKVADPAYFESQGKTAPFYYQGVLWVDPTTYDIVMLRTDLLAPLADLQLRQLTTELTFRSVPIHGYDAVFWLPREVNISSDQGAGPAEENHRYSDYHLFHAETRIFAGP